MKMVTIAIANRKTKIVKNIRFIACFPSSITVVSIRKVVLSILNEIDSDDALWAYIESILAVKTWTIANFIMIFSWVYFTWIVISSDPFRANWANQNCAIFVDQGTSVKRTTNNRYSQV